MAKRLIVSVVVLLVVFVLGIGLGCAAPATPTPTVTPGVTPGVTPKVTPGVTPTEAAPGVKAIKIHLAEAYALGTASYVYAEYFKALIEERSGGKIKVDHYPAAQLFAQTDEYHAVGTGAVEMILPSLTVLAGISTPAWNLVFAGARYFKDVKAHDDFWAEPAGGGYFKSLLEKDGVKSMDAFHATTRLAYSVIGNKRPIKKMEDWKGLKMATMVGGQWEVAGYGCSAIPIPNPEMITALQTGMVDGRYASQTGILAAGWDRVTKYATPIGGPGIRRIYSPLANLAWWNGLNDATRAMILKAWKDADRWHWDVWIPENDVPTQKRFQAAFTAPGKEFYDMEKDDPAEFERHRVVYANGLFDILKKYVPPEVLNLAEAKYKR